MPLRPLFVCLCVWTAVFAALSPLLTDIIGFLDPIGVAVGGVLCTASLTIVSFWMRRKFQDDSSGTVLSLLVMIKPLVVFAFLYWCYQIGLPFLLSVVIGGMVLIPASITYSIWLFVRNTKQKPKRVRRFRQ